MGRLASPVLLVALFAAGVANLLIAFAVFWAGWLKIGQNRSLPRVFMGTLGVLVVFMVQWAVAVDGKLRWVAVGLIAILVLGFSALTIASIGILIAPVGLVLFAFSLWKIFRSSPNVTGDFRQ